MRPAVCLLVILLAFQSVGAQNAYHALLSALYAKTVRTIAADSLEEYRKAVRPVVLDTRTLAEYEVSHIKGAQLVDYESFDKSMVAGILKNTPIVVYCSVGYRSERIGEKLQELGFNNVCNLYGGLFEWKNKGGTVVNKRGQPTDSVHCYNRLWAVWLQKGIKLYE